jgi:hypothetical protein
VQKEISSSQPEESSRPYASTDEADRLRWSSTWTTAPPPDGGGLGGSVEPRTSGSPVASRKSECIHALVAVVRSYQTELRRVLDDGAPLCYVDLRRG